MATAEPSVETLRRRRGDDENHLGIVALRQVLRDKVRDGEISLGQAALVRLVMRRRPEAVIEALEDSAALKIEKAIADGDSSTVAKITDWDVDDWIKLIQEVFSIFMEALPALMGMCG